MTNEEKRKIYAALSAPFPPEAIERTKGSMTGKGYDTAGIRAQFLINRINEVLGAGSYRVHRTIEVRSFTNAKGRTMHEAVCDMTVELGSYDSDGNWKAWAESIGDGGHQAASLIDAKKGAHTGALKRCLAGFGIGKDAWEGKLDNAPDDDNMPSDEWMQERRNSPAPAAPHPAPAAAPQPTPQGYVRIGPAVDTTAQQPDRNRVSARQIAAVHSIARKLGIETAALRARVKNAMGKQLEFISKNEASELIKQLDAQLNGNGQDAELAS